MGLGLNFNSDCLARLVLVALCAIVCHGFHFHKFPQLHCKSLKSTQTSELPISSVPYSGVGCVLIAKPEEKERFYSNAAVLIFSLANNMTHGVVLDKPGAFYLGDTTPGIGPFKTNLVFVGGNEGPELAHMFHPYDFGKQCLKVSEGVYSGGMGPALELLDSFKGNPKEFKFLFRNLEWKQGQLEKEIADGRWDVCKLPASLILSQKKETGYIWSAARKALFNANTEKIKEFNSEVDYEFNITL